jgi:hypothetical protein
MREVIEKPTGFSDLVWIVSISAAATVLAFFLIDHLQMRFELYQTAQERAHQAWQQRQLIFQEEHLELEKRYRAREMDWSEDSAVTQGLAPLSSDQTVSVEAK